MNLSLEIKKRQVEIMKVEAAKCEQELRIEECLEQIERLKASIVKSEEHAEKLNLEIKELKAR